MKGVVSPGLGSECRPTGWTRGIFFAALGLFVTAHAQDRVRNDLSDPAKRQLHEQAKALPGARQAGACAST